MKQYWIDRCEKELRQQILQELQYYHRLCQAWGLGPLKLRRSKGGLLDIWVEYWDIQDNRVPQFSTLELDSRVKTRSSSLSSSSSLKPVIRCMVVIAYKSTFVSKGGKTGFFPLQHHWTSWKTSERSIQQKSKGHFLQVSFPLPCKFFFCPKLKKFFVFKGKKEDLITAEKKISLLGLQEDEYHRPSIRGLLQLGSVGLL